MNLPPVIPIVFLCLGALAVGASQLARLRVPSLVMATATVVALVAVLTLRVNLPATQIISAWQPVSVFAVPISFRVDQTAWILSVGLLAICLAAALTWQAHPGRQHPGPRAVSLLLVAAAIASQLAAADAASGPSTRQVLRACAALPLVRELPAGEAPLAAQLVAVAGRGGEENALFACRALAEQGTAGVADGLRAVAASPNRAVAALAAAALAGKPTP